MPSRAGLRPLSAGPAPERHLPLEETRFDAEGNLVISASALARAGIGPDSPLTGSVLGSGLYLAADTLRKVYVEVTSHCNFACATCIRHAWDEPLGSMPLDRYRRLLGGLPQPGSGPAPTLAFGGFGEPLVHSDFLAMVQLARARGLPVELITNGWLLNAELSRELVALDVAQIAISMDGADDPTYADVRGNGLEPVLKNLTALCAVRRRARSRLRVGLAFVAMKRNIASLPGLLRLASELALDFVSISNVIPHTPEMAGEALWGRSAWESNFPPAHWRPRLLLARIDVDKLTRSALEPIWREAPVTPPPSLDAGTWRNYCRFAHEGMAAVSWDGNVAPCLSLLHSHPEYICGHWKQVRRYSCGQVDALALADIWRQPDYRQLRQRLRAFDFPACFVCGGCPSTESNEEDCYGNPFPVCSECLWAQGIVLCP